MRGLVNPLRIKIAGLFNDPAETTTACFARMTASFPSLSLTRAPMQCFLELVGVYCARVASVGEGAEDEVAKRRRSTLVSMKNFAPPSAASRSQETTPLCFSE